MLCQIPPAAARLFPVSSNTPARPPSPSVASVQTFSSSLVCVSAAESLLQQTMISSFKTVKTLKSSRNLLFRTIDGEAAKPHTKETNSSHLLCLQEKSNLDAF